MWKVFKKYHDAFLEQMAVHLIRRGDEINLKGTTLVLCHANLSHLKKRDNLRLFMKFAIQQVQVLERERKALGDFFNQVAVKYFEISLNYALNSKD